MDITQETNKDESMVTGRNGHFELSAIRVYMGAGKFYIDGIGKSGRTLNAGFVIDAPSFNSLLDRLNAEQQ